MPNRLCPVWHQVVPGLTPVFCSDATHAPTGRPIVDSAQSCAAAEVHEGLPVAAGQNRSLRAEASEIPRKTSRSALVMVSRRRDAEPTQLDPLAKNPLCGTPSERQDFQGFCVHPGGWPKSTGFGQRRMKGVILHNPAVGALARWSRPRHAVAGSISATPGGRLSEWGQTYRGSRERTVRCDSGVAPMVTGSQLDRRHTDAGRPTRFQVVAAALLILLAGTLHVWAQVETRSSTLGRNETIDPLIQYLSPWARGTFITLGVIGIYLGLCFLLLWRAPLTLLWVHDQVPFQDLATKLSPEKYAYVAVLVNLVIQLTGLPFFAKHARTRRTWCRSYQEGQRQLDDLKPPIREAYLQHTEILDAWVEQTFEVANRNFRAWPPFHERQTYVPLPVVKDAKTVPNLTPEHVQPVFKRGRCTVFIAGEGGAGKTTLACQMALWGMAEDPAERLCPDHRMLPVLIGPGIGFDPLREASRLRDTIRGHLQRLVEATDPIPDDLFDKLLRHKRLLVILDGLSEMVQEPESDASKEARPRNPSFTVAALIITSRQLDNALEPLDVVIEPLRLDTDHLLPFLNAYLAAAGKARLTDAELYRACSRLAEMVGTERGITPLLARLYAEQLIDEAQEDGTVHELPETIPDLMLRYLNSLNRDRQSSDPDNPTVHRVAKVAAWCCLKSTYRPGTASKKDLCVELAKLNTSHSSDDLLSYLEHRLRVIQTIEPAKTHVQFALDSLAEYLAGLQVIEENHGRDAHNKWKGFLNTADNMPGAPEAIKGFLLAVRDCCLASKGEVPDFVPDELGRRGGLDPELMQRLQLKQRVRHYINNLYLPHADDRRHAAETLGEIGPAAKDAVPDLVKLLDDPDEGVRRAAASALGRNRARGQGRHPRPGQAARTTPIWACDGPLLTPCVQIGPAAKDVAPDLIKLLERPR